MTEAGTGLAPSAGAVDMKFEVVVLPVSDTERARDFYARLGWRQDHTPSGSGIVQFTPHGSGCSVQFGGNRTTATPGSAQGLWLIVSDLQAALDRMEANGIQVDEVYHSDATGRHGGLHPERQSYSSFAAFHDPDGNRWVLQEVTQRAPGRVDASTTSFASGTDLQNALIRAATAHGEHEKRNGGVRDEQWPVWYSEYMVAEQSGAKLPE
jgi:catechol 2,3-dioxygenase-like lactoylglutathione lyase family enzyme